MTKTNATSTIQEMHTPPVVAPDAWEAAREQMLVKEKAHTRARDALAAERRRMPWMAVEKAYAFEGPKGKVSLLDLFEGRRQLIVYRAFFEPGVFGWPEHACRGCSLGADQVAHLAHLNARDPTLAWRRAQQPPQVSAEIEKAIQPLIASLPEGSRIETGGNIEESGKANRALSVVFPAMIVLMVTVIIVQVRSFPAMFMVVLTAPLGLAGVVPTLVLFHQPFGFNAILGLIALAGILMRNTLILIGQI